MDHEIQSRLKAYSAGGDKALIWTPEIVGLRMIEAYEVLTRLPATWGPRGTGSAWPAMLQEWEDLLDPEAWRQRLAEEPKKIRPSKDEMSRADEALLWPMRLLSDKPLYADALMVWAGGKATGKSIKAKLAARNARAKALAIKMTIAENERRARKRATIASVVAMWANRKLKEAKGDAERCANIKSNADIRFRREIADADAYNTTIKPDQALPNKVRTEKTLERYRKAACQIVADVLNEKHVELREAQDY